MRVGILTGGGDCPGLNAVIRAVVRATEEQHGGNVIGYRHGWRGVAQGDSVELTGTSTHALLAMGGTVLGTSRYHPADHDGATERVLDTLARDRIDALIVLGGDGTLSAATALCEAGVAIVGVPKTIDNDVGGTDRCVGFDTALSIATDAIDRVHTTAESHDRAMVIEVMGHRTGWLAVGAGIAGGVHVILTPEEPFDMDQIAAHMRHRHQRESFSIIVVAEGAVPSPADSSGRPVPPPPCGADVGNIGTWVRSEIAARTGFETRLVVLGHVQRGGTPTASDRLLGTRFGVAAVDAAHAGDVGTITALQGDRITLMPLAEATRELRAVPADLLAVAHTLTA